MSKDRREQPAPGQPVPSQPEAAEHRSHLPAAPTPPQGPAPLRPAPSGCALLRSRTGSGTPLVLLPGFGEDSTAWLPALPALAARHEVILLDLPGFGTAPPLPSRLWPTSRALAKTVAAELDRLGVSRPHVAGFSLGGRVGLELGRRGRARSVVAIGPNGTGTPVEQAYLVGLLSAKRLLAGALHPLAELPGGEHLARLFLATEHARPWHLHAQQARHLLAGFAHSPGYWKTLACTAVDVALGMHQVTCPVLLLHGSLDLIALGQPPRFLFLLPHAQLRTIVGAGHNVVPDAPAETAAELLSFLTAIDSASQRQ